MEFKRPRDEIDLVQVARGNRRVLSHSHLQGSRSTPIVDLIKLQSDLELDELASRQAWVRALELEIAHNGDRAHTPTLCDQGGNVALVLPLPLPLVLLLLQFEVLLPLIQTPRNRSRYSKQCHFS